MKGTTQMSKITRLPMPPYEPWMEARREYRSQHRRRAMLRHIVILAGLAVLAIGLTV